jgi:hypothetical protein
MYIALIIFIRSNPATLEKAAQLMEKKGLAIRYQRCILISAP